MLKYSTIIAVSICVAALTAACVSEKANESGSALEPGLDAPALLARAQEAMGGAERLKSLEFVTVAGRGHWFQWDQAAYPDGPCPLQYFEFVEHRDLTGSRMRTELTVQFTEQYTFTNSVVYAGGVTAVEQFGQPLAPAEPMSSEWFEIGIERILLTAEGAGDISAAPVTILDGLPHVPLTFTWKGNPATIYLRADTYLPTVVEVTRPLPGDGDYGTWNDVTTRYRYADWRISPDGTALPWRWDVAHNGQLFRSFRVMRMSLNEPPPDGTFLIPEEVRTAYAEKQQSPEPLSLDTEEEVADGVVLVGRSGMFATLVAQDDGVVVLDAPLDERFSAAVIDVAQRRFPDLELSAVVSTAYTWNYFTGLKGYAELGLPIYVDERAMPLVRSFLESLESREEGGAPTQSYSSRLIAVGGQTTVGTGDNRIELYPVRSTTVRMLAWLPERGVLYASDAHFSDFSAQHQQGSWLRSFSAELVATVEDLGLKPGSAFSLHMHPFSWDDFVSGVGQYRPGGE